MRRNKDFREGITAQFKADIQKNESYTARETGKKGYSKALGEMGEEDILNQLLDFESRNARLKAYGFDSFSSYQPTAGGSDVGQLMLRHVT
jgi:hypothetical protein